MVSYIGFYPKNAGNSLRVWYTVDHLLRLGHVVDFIHYDTERTSEIDIASMKRKLGHQHYYKIEPNTSIDIKRCKRFLRLCLDKLGLGNKIIINYTIDEWYSKKIDTKVLELKSKYSYDIIWVEYVMYSKLLNLFDEKVLKVIDTHDRMADRANMFLRNGEIPSWFYTDKRNERKGLSRADVVIPMQRIEGRYFEKILVGTDTKVITPGFYVDTYKMDVSNSLQILFVGSDNPANVKSITWFIREVYPLIKEKNAQCQLVLAGKISNCVPNSLKYIKLGYVDDIRKVYEESRIVIAPIVMGTGINVKVVEALGFGKPMVITSCAAKGIKSKNKIYLQADNPYDYAHAVNDLLINDKLCRELSKNAVRYMQRNNKIYFVNLNRICEMKK